MSFDLASGVASFDYLARGATSEYPFTEVVTFPLPERQLDAQTLVVLERVLELLTSRSVRSTTSRWRRNR